MTWRTVAAVTAGPPSVLNVAKMAAAKMNWDKRISWGSAGTRKTSRFFSEALVKRCGCNAPAGEETRCSFSGGTERR